MKKMIKKLLALTLSAVTLVASVGALSGCDIDWNYCQHTLEEIEKVDASCMKVGKKTAYKCTKCEKLFAYGYLNGKDGEKGIYEIKSQEMLPFAGHKIGSFYGDLKDDMTTFDASSLEDFSVWSHCSEEGCGEAFEVEPQNLIAFAPADNLGNATHVVEGEETDATRFAIAAGTASGTMYQITTADSGMDNATHRIPFDANTDRFIVLFLHNDGKEDVNVRYGTEFYGERCGADAIVPANGYATISFSINITGSNSDSYHELYINSDITESFNLTISGYYYHETKLQNVKIDEYPTQTEYAIGETFNPEGMVVLANYGDGITRKLDADEYTLVLNNNKPITEPLTAEDDTVYVIHQNKQTEVTIRVQKFEQTITLKKATFADGTMSKVLERNTLLPTDIVVTGGKVAYFMDQYGAKYVPGEGKVPAYNATLTPIYEGVSFSDNYALGKGVEASITSHGGQTSALVDGIHSMNSKDDNRWSSDSNYDTATPEEADREWVTVDLGEVKAISQVVLYPRVWGSYFPEAYEILVSEDGENWTAVASVEADELASKNSTMARYHNFESVNAQYVKVVATKMTNDNGSYGYIFQLSEIEIFGEVQVSE